MIKRLIAVGLIFIYTIRAMEEDSRYYFDTRDGKHIAIEKHLIEHYLPALYNLMIGPDETKASSAPLAYDKHILELLDRCLTSINDHNKKIILQEHLDQQLKNKEISTLALLLQFADQYNNKEIKKYTSYLLGKKILDVIHTNPSSKHIEEKLSVIPKFLLREVYKSISTALIRPNQPIKRVIQSTIKETPRFISNESFSWLTLHKYIRTYTISSKRFKNQLKKHIITLLISQDKSHTGCLMHDTSQPNKKILEISETNNSSGSWLLSCPDQMHLINIANDGKACFRSPYSICLVDKENNITSHPVNNLPQNLSFHPTNSSKIFFSYVYNQKRKVAYIDTSAKYSSHQIDCLEISYKSPKMYVNRDFIYIPQNKEIPKLTMYDLETQAALGTFYAKQKSSILSACITNNVGAYNQYDSLSLFDLRCPRPVSVISNFIPPANSQFLQQIDLAPNADYILKSGQNSIHVWDLRFYSKQLKHITSEDWIPLFWDEHQRRANYDNNLKNCPFGKTNKSVQKFLQ